MQTTERFEKVDIDRLIPYARNARTHSKEQVRQLRSSLREYGFVNPVLCDKDYNIIAGHGRIMAAKEEGYKEIPCVFVEHLTDTQKKAYILVDNRLALSAGWDDDLLMLEFADLKDLGFDLDLTGFDPNEIEKLFAAKDGSVKDDNFDLDAALKEAAFVLSGDIWTLGRHRLMCGDSTKEEDILRLMGGKQANCVLTDPPYGIFYQKSKVGTIQNDDLQGEKLYNFLLASFTQMEKAMAKDACIYIFHADTEGLNFRRAFDDAGFKLSACCIWNKNMATFGRSDWKWKHEPVLYGWKKSGKHVWHGDQKQTTVWDIDKPPKSDIHPTQKPIPLLAIPLKNSTVTNSIVLDPFAGSASTLICCEQLGRICYTMELDEKYASASIRRFAELCGSDDITCERDGQLLRFADLVKEVANE